ncbi:MAG: DUF3426 domain-containing protein [Polaromonas sp.]|uniref:DUF3426 domain-containing protein n=1 Tax=Polaromonas sp. TaxID=1869339 RepID=UPI002731FB93|nr:DUF3426 domain-containing protein [Polaromonas sp.]MDP2450839.1 DUF3426 domain-containing protein [Polaromonas sp.]MDP3248102.1 DUF3426 domain-containing protein [Polaromonas sp.]MDP3753974.1 DUF3426 domain-containing protein [Polaromonas sp.]
MSLITRCSACGTMFKVVADQLKISQGWVRCGHCSEVFDAAANLQPYAPPSTASPTDSPVSTPQDVSPDMQEDTGRAASVAPMLLAPSAEPKPDWSDAVLMEEAEEVAPVVAPASVPEVQVSPSPDLAADVFAFSVSPEHSGFPESAAPAARAGSAESAFGESETAVPDHVHEVSFVRDARRDAFWRRPALRVALGLAASVLLAALLLQVALFQRNTLAVSQPWLRPALDTLCASLQCEIRPPQQIESVVIESSTFNKLAADAYRLKVVIRNAGAIPLALPSLELTLTDTQDQAQLRRVLSPAELGATDPTLAAGAEFSGVLAIRILNSPPDASATQSSPTRPSAPLRIAGYRVLAFYP